MKRREFITLLGGAAVAWPLAARAQQAGKLPTIGFLGASTPSGWSHYVAAFEQRLRELGWIEGRNVAIDIAGRRDARALRRDLRPSSSGSRSMSSLRREPQSLAAKQATSVIPIVFALANDPVGIGLVASLARPGGNVTGSVESGDRSCRQAARTVERVGSRRSAGWRSWAMSVIPAPCWKWARFRQRPARSVSRSARSEIRRAEDIAPAFERSRAVRRRFMSFATRSWTPTGFASTPWR